MVREVEKEWEQFRGQNKIFLGKEESNQGLAQSMSGIDLDAPMCA